MNKTVTFLLKYIFSWGVYYTILIYLPLYLDSSKPQPPEWQNTRTEIESRVQNETSFLALSSTLMRFLFFVHYFGFINRRSGTEIATNTTLSNCLQRGTLHRHMHRHFKMHKKWLGICLFMHISCLVRFCLSAQ